MNTHTAEREIICGDAIEWLAQNSPLEGSSIITSLPDVSGMPTLSLESWKEWFVKASALCLSATPDNGVTIFYQTDIKVDGTWVDKAFLCQKAAEETGSTLLWHKIFSRGRLDQPTFGRPGFAHLLCFSRGVRDRIEQSYPDVYSTQGEMTWSRATGIDACELACKYVESHTETRRIVDPFCGHGTVLAVANRRGLNAIGVEIGRRRAQKARRMKLETMPTEKSYSALHQHSAPKR